MADDIDNRVAECGPELILGWQPDPFFDGIVAAAAHASEVPFATLSFSAAGEERCKAVLGDLPTRYTSDKSLAIATRSLERTVVIEDTFAADATRRVAPVVGGQAIRFFAATPVRTRSGSAIGSLNVFDRAPRGLSAHQTRALEALSRQVTAWLERVTIDQQEAAATQLKLQIVDSAVDYAIFSMDLAGVVTTWNEGARRIFGWPAEEACGQLGEIIFTSEDRARGVPEQEIGSALKMGRSMDERWHVRNDGTRFWASGEMLPLRNDGGQPTGVMKIVRDRTENWLASRPEFGTLFASSKSAPSPSQCGPASALPRPAPLASQCLLG